MEDIEILTNKELQELVSVLIKESIIIKDSVKDIRLRLISLEDDVGSIKVSMGMMAELLENLCDKQPQM
jgi:hypothetical protein